MLMLMVLAVILAGVAAGNSVRTRRAMRELEERVMATVDALDTEIGAACEARQIIARAGRRHLRAIR